jgi:hypothetical protein
MDIGTAKDMIEDMHHEIAQLKYEVAHFMAEVRTLNKDVRSLVKVIEKVYYKDGEYHHLNGCLSGLMCSCGLIHYLAYRKAQK